MDIITRKEFEKKLQLSENEMFDNIFAIVIFIFSTSTTHLRDLKPI